MAVDQQQGGSRNTGRRVALALGTVAVLVVAFLLLRGGGNDNGGSGSSGSAQSTTQQSQPSSAQQQSTSTGSSSSSQGAQKPAVAVLRVTNGKPANGVQKLSFKQGDQIRFLVRSTTKVPIHFHGYDVEKEAAPGKPAVYNVKGSISGRFVVEVESTGTQIAEIDVTP
jgi:FtsP/CotA-like multicopper oxidase with cupredoxin domain